MIYVDNGPYVESFTAKADAERDATENIKKTPPKVIANTVIL